jgi:hypothetical protein
LVHRAEDVGDAPHLDDPAVDDPRGFDFGELRDAPGAGNTHEVSDVHDRDVHVVYDPVVGDELAEILNGHVETVGLGLHLGA